MLGQLSKRRPYAYTYSTTITQLQATYAMCSGELSTDTTYNVWSIIIIKFKDDDDFIMFDAALCSIAWVDSAYEWQYS